MVERVLVVTGAVAAVAVGIAAAETMPIAAVFCLRGRMLRHAAALL